MLSRATTNAVAHRASSMRRMRRRPRVQQALLRHQRLHQLLVVDERGGVAHCEICGYTRRLNYDPSRPGDGTATPRSPATPHHRPPQRDLQSGAAGPEASMTGSTLDRARLERLIGDETAAFERANPSPASCSSGPGARCSTASR